LSENWSKRKRLKKRKGGDGRVFRSERVSEILRNNYHIVRKEDLSREELDFLSYFFELREEEEIDEETLKVEKFIVLEKKPKYLYH